MLAAVTPLFAATAFRPAWWQTLIAATIGSALGQVAVRLTRGRRLAAWSVMAVAAILAGVAGGWSLTHAARNDGSSGNAFLVVRSTTGGRSTLTWDDFVAIQTQIPSIHLAVPYLRKAEQLLAGESNWQTEVIGTTPDYFELRSLHVVAGDRFEASAGESGQKVVVLGDTVVAQLFGATPSPVGEIVRINNMPFTIVGVLAHQGMSPAGQDLDDVAIVPVQVFASRIASTIRFDGAVLVSPMAPGEAARVEGELRGLLRDRHRLAAGDDDDFVIRDSGSR